MQLKYNRQPKMGNTLLKISLRIVLAIVIFIVTIFLIEKYNFPVQKKFKIDVTNEIKVYLISLLIIFLPYLKSK